MAQKYGVDIKGGNISYGENDLTLKLMVTRNDIDVQKAEFMDNIKYSFTAFTADDYLKTFTINGNDYQLIGFKPGNKYSVLGKRVKDGKVYGFTYDGAKAAFGR